MGECAGTPSIIIEMGMTLRSGRPGGRINGKELTTIGFPDLVANDENAYVAIAWDPVCDRNRPPTIR